MTTKGRISSVSADGKTATVVPSFGDAVTHALAVPAALQGILFPGTEVIYCSFPDMTGTILCRTDAVENGNSGGGESGCGIGLTVENGMLCIKCKSGV